MDNEIIILHVMNSCGYKTRTALASAFGMSRQNFNKQKNTESMRNRLILHAMDKGISRHWVETGQGELKAAPSTDAEYWKDKYLTCMEELIEAHKKIDRLTASPTTAAQQAASSGKREM